jgi:lipopolysaccharide/colanic/teichoic acid biosynthesis glycosyltransferase
MSGPFAKNLCRLAHWTTVVVRVLLKRSEQSSRQLMSSDLSDKLREFLMTNTQLNFATTGTSALDPEFIAPYEPDERKQVFKDGAGDVMTIPSSYPLKHDVQARLSLIYKLTKRTLDLLLACSGLFVLSPFLLTIALLIKAETPGPAIFKQRRRGLNGITFWIWKFRTMSVQEDGPTVEQARRGDRRVTRIGYLLRRSSIDELPQLLNVIRGEMSLVGPRPHPLALDDKHRTLITNYDLRHGAKPGITGWAQINGCRGECSELIQMQSRIDYDLWYIGNQSVFLDLRILFATILSLSYFDAY